MVLFCSDAERSYIFSGLLERNIVRLFFRRLQLSFAEKDVVLHLRELELVVLQNVIVELRLSEHGLNGPVRAVVQVLAHVI